MESEQPCPHCKRVHFSIYTAERCAARHQVTSGMTDYINEERKKREKQIPLQTNEKKEQPEPLN
jgi:hypothetical protein